MADKLIYLIYPIVLILLFAGAKVSRRKTWNEEAFSLRQMKMLQGMAAICIMLHHLGQKTCAPWHSKKVIVHGLDFFVPIGYFLVALFFFCSGYGLYKSWKTKPNYLEGFLKRRVLPLVVAYYLSGLVFLAVRYLMKEKISGWQLFCYLSGIKLCNINAWYVIALPIFYLFFYLAFRFCKKENAAVAVTAAAVLIYILIGTMINHNDYWMRGEWWYNSVHLFVVGILFARSEEKKIASMKRLYPLRLVGSLLLIFVFYVLSEWAADVISYYGENFDPLYWRVVLRRWGCLIPQLLASYYFVRFLFLLSLKVKLGNPVLKFMSGITLEFYLIHGIFVELFGYDFLELTKSLVYIRNVTLHLLLVVVLSIPATLLFKKVYDLVCRPLVGRK